MHSVMANSLIALEKQRFALTVFWKDRLQAAAK
jgi:hypothetical protein